MDKKQLFDTIIQTVKSFNGDIYGSVIRDYKINKSTDITNINCRIDAIFLNVFLQNLNVFFDIIDMPVPLNYNFLYIAKSILLSIKPTNPLIQPTIETSSIILNISVMTNFDWYKLPCDLDVNLFAENTMSRYLRSNYTVLNRFTDKYEYVENRIKNKKFCVVDFISCKNVEQINMLIERVYNMIRNGWVMDDLIWKDKTWVLNNWITIQMRPKTLRTNYNETKIKRMIEQDECILCNEKFNPTDIVINTCCNHNFHWNVDNHHKCKGLIEWTKRGKSTCPYCRGNML